MKSSYPFGSSLNLELWHHHRILKTHIRHYDVICSYIGNTYTTLWRHTNLCCLCQMQNTNGLCQNSKYNTNLCLNNSSYPTRTEFNNCLIKHSNGWLLPGNQNVRDRFWPIACVDFEQWTKFIDQNSLQGLGVSW